MQSWMVITETMIATANKLKEWVGLPSYRDAIVDQFWQRKSSTFVSRGVGSIVQVLLPFSWLQVHRLYAPFLDSTVFQAGYAVPGEDVAKANIIREIKRTGTIIDTNGRWITHFLCACSLFFCVLFFHTRSVPLFRSLIMQAWQSSCFKKAFS